ncbi:hypothetical protein [Sporolactobacillus terrae]|uniref:hypothetical protein n=1 Tax=Sporolactobacillus terrae TaxID=269673 RepID=UPI00048E0D57|nr:hypothetical protein [Sporolactobacillus terrae]
MRSRVYYDSDYEGNLYPLWYTLEGSIDWEQPTFYFPVSTPFERVDSISFDDGIIGCSVLAQELIVHQNKPNQLGIDLEAVRSRISENIKPYNVERLIIQIANIEETLKVGKELFEWC